MLFLDPISSYMPLLWFVHALFLMFVVYPVMRLFLNNFVIILLLLILNTIIDNHIVVVGKMLANMPFFVLGVVFNEHGSVMRKFIAAKWHYLLAALLVFSVYYWLRIFITGQLDPPYIDSFILGVSGAILTINLSQIISTSANPMLKRILLPIGYYSMSIYLLHSLFESAVRIGFLQLVKQIQLPFVAIALIAVICGVIFPLLLEQKILRKFSFTRKYLLGYP
jgi:peptidoglycan/LPS O-acetylase OafA/YrhL